MHIHIHTQSVLPAPSLESGLLRDSESQSLPLSLGEEYFYSGIQDVHWEKGARGGGVSCVVKWDPPYQWLQWGLGTGWRSQSEKVVFISCLISCRLSSAFCSILSLPGFSGERGTRGTKITALLLLSLGVGPRQEKLLLLCLWVPGPFCGGDREVGDVTEGWETEDPGRAKASVWQRGLELKELKEWVKDGIQCLREVGSPIVWEGAVKNSVWGKK